MKEGAVLVHASAQEMAVRAENIARRMLWQQPHIDIIHDLGITARQFEWTTKQPFYQKILESLQHEAYNELDVRFREKLGDAQELAKRTTYESMNKLIDLMRAGASQTLQRECANDIIKYSGDISPNREGGGPNIGNQQINLIMVALKEDDAIRSSGGHGQT